MQLYWPDLASRKCKGKLRDTSQLACWPAELSIRIQPVAVDRRRTSIIISWAPAPSSRRSCSLRGFHHRARSWRRIPKARMTSYRGGSDARELALQGLAPLFPPSVETLPGQNAAKQLVGRETCSFCRWDRGLGNIAGLYRSRCARPGGMRHLRKRERSLASWMQCPGDVWRPEVAGPSPWWLGTISADGILARRQQRLVPQWCRGLGDGGVRDGPFGGFWLPSSPHFRFTADDWRDIVRDQSMRSAGTTSRQRSSH